ncbi:MAG: UDP-N-acetylglucosamine diphosphorylase [Verrucomicrobiota bacterium]
MSWEPSQFLDSGETEHWALFRDLPHVWDALPRIKDYLKENLRPGMHGQYLGSPEQVFLESDHVFIGEGTVVEPGAVIKGPAWIGANCQIRPGAYVRGNVIIGDNCVIGNSCEFKNCVLFNGAQVPHFSYVGDSILGAGAHLGAGVICSNLKLNGEEVVLRTAEGDSIPTGLRKFGAVLGDHAEAGCNSVLNPGSILGRQSLVYPGVAWRGILPAKHLGKRVGEIVPRRDR